MFMFRLRRIEAKLKHFLPQNLFAKTIFSNASLRLIGIAEIDRTVARVRVKQRT